MSSQIICLVLGGRGFIGSHLVDALLAHGYRVRCFNRAHSMTQGEIHPFDQNLEFFEGDLTSEADIIDALTDCTICFHLVSTTLPKSSNTDPVYDVESNVISTLRLLNHAIKIGLRKIIFVSSGGTIYGIPLQLPIPESHPTNPLCSYGITKLSIEKYLDLFNHLYGLNYTVLRIANPYGERQRLQASQGAVAVFLGKILRGEPIDIWGDGSIVRDYIYISDVIDALMASLKETEEHIFNIGSGHGHSLNEILDVIERVTGRSSIRQYLPARSFDVPESVLSIEKARKILGWEPKIDFDTGVHKFTCWLKEHHGF